MEYKVMTQKDRFFSGKFNPEKLEAALNSYARRAGVSGWPPVNRIGLRQSEDVFVLGEVRERG